LIRMAKGAKAQEKRIDTEDGAAYTYEELAAFYKGKYKRNAIDQYWESLKVAKGGKAAAKGKAKAKAAPEPKGKAKAKAKVKAKAKAKADKEGGNKRNIVIGYHAIRGLAAPLRMMCFYQNQQFENVAYGKDMKESWFGGDKPKLIEKNAAINLPYILDKTNPKDEKVITQSNTCLLYLGRLLRLDKPRDFFHNHLVLDQTMDWRNDTMKIVYPFAGVVKSKDEFAEGANKHLAESTKTHMTKLEGLCQGDYMCGNSPQSADFHVFEMLDQHIDIAAKVGAANPLEGYPKLQKLHASFKASSKLAKYWEADLYKDYFTNNGLAANHSGKPDGAEYGPSETKSYCVKEPREPRGKKGEGKSGEATEDKDGYPIIKYGAEVPEALKDPKKEKKMAKIIKAGGKRGVEIEGAADMGGLKYFCTVMSEPGGDVDMLYESMKGANEKSDPSEEERKGGSGRIGKMFVSVDQENSKMGMVAYCPPAYQKTLRADDWLKIVLKAMSGSPEDSFVFGDAYTAKASIANNPEKGVFVLKIKDEAITKSYDHLKSVGLFPDKADDSDSDPVFGDEDFPCA